MNIGDLPPNSDKSKAPPQEQNPPKRVERVVKGEAVKRKKGLGQKFRETFFSGDGRTASEYVVLEVLIPEAKNMIVDAGQRWLEAVVNGKTGRKRPTHMGMATGHIQYNRFSMGAERPPETRPAMSRRGRTMHDFDEIVLEDRGEAEEVLDRLFDCISKFGSVNVADLYVMVGIKSTHTDQKWGWEDLRGASVSRLPRGGGYVLDLPDPEPFA